MKKTVIVTGARRGLGLAICSRLAADGYKVVAVGRSESEELNSLRAAGNVFFELFDLSNVEEIHTWVNVLTKRYGRIYGLVNNAAVGSDGVLATMHERDIADSLLVNLQSPIVLTKYVSRSMLLAGGGRVINISSIIGFTGFSGLSVYAATKAGIIGFTKSLSRELGKAGITVNCIAPGYMDTDMTKGIAPDKLMSIKRRSPSGKLASVESVAGSVSYLLGDDAAMINGTTITVDAGSTA
ncbi:SDR family NAD(P)-dependent oxidoreductase [Undibacterium jejuense]|uniref:SDR family NAD(P)-dependent oxidoreductase n=1 Tax=Undibacterium jejuense TaxID=1344949 RepID=A0A923KRN1_9BURK|nr:SDR family NAD(P)-dependent oxidoreductase [Undibacterium jejuense]MBC3864179.1 SDR family NAD(P)-dependent oxidoreductase [Undibacterium jejuense]